MVAISVDASEFNALTVQMRDNVSRVGSGGARILRRSTRYMETIGKLNCPVASGHLLSTIGPAKFTGDGRSGEMTGSVSATASYASYVERGTSKMAPRAFLGPAFDRAQPDFVSGISALGAGILGRGGV